MMDSTIISRVMKIKSKRVQMKEMQSWTPAEQVRHLCPEGVMPLEEFRKIGIQMINDMYEER